MLANTSKHTKYITTTLAYLQDQLRKYPVISEQLQVRGSEILVPIVVKKLSIFVVGLTHFLSAISVK